MHNTMTITTVWIHWPDSNCVLFSQAQLTHKQCAHDYYHLRLNLHIISCNTKYVLHSTNNCTYMLHNHRLVVGGRNYLLCKVEQQHSQMIDWESDKDYHRMDEKHSTKDILHRGIFTEIKMIYLYHSDTITASIMGIINCLLSTNIILTN